VCFQRSLSGQNSRRIETWCTTASHYGGLWISLIQRTFSQIINHYDDSYINQKAHHFLLQTKQALKNKIVWQLSNQCHFNNIHILVLRNFYGCENIIKVSLDMCMQVYKRKVILFLHRKFYKYVSCFNCNNHKYIYRLSKMSMKQDTSSNESHIKNLHF
jgi:hypothetical protein